MLPLIHFVTISLVLASEKVLTILLAVSNSWLGASNCWQQQNESRPSALTFFSHVQIKLTFFALNDMECCKSILVENEQLYGQPRLVDKGQSCLYDMKYIT